MHLSSRQSTASSGCELEYNLTHRLECRTFILEGVSGMAARADIAVYDSQGELGIIVDIKNKLGTDDEWAAKMRRNLVAHGFLPKVPFFLLALPDRFYLWKDKYLPQLEKPQYELDPSSFLESYFERAGVQPSSITETGFELLTVLCLSALTHKNE